MPRAIHRNTDMGFERRTAPALWDTAVMTRACLRMALYACAVFLGPTGPAAANGGPIAQILCAPSDVMRHRLETRYRAQRAWAGLRNPDEVVELWEDPEGDWTLVITYTGGNWCIVAMGDALLPFAFAPNG